jgi:hypothetical protein
MNEIIFLIEEAPEGGYTARALGESIYTEADTIEDLQNQIRDAVRCHFDEGKVPKVIRLHHVREEIITT